MQIVLTGSLGQIGKPLASFLVAKAVPTQRLANP